MIRSLAAFLLLALVPACSGPCDPNHVCALDRDDAVCDGNDYVVCDSTTAGKRISCTPSRVAVCTPTGWSFETP